MAGDISMLRNNLPKKAIKGMAMPIVILICFCIMIMATSIFFFRKESKQQNVTNFHFLRVNFLAQSAIQHALLKLSAFPQESYDSGVLALGYCPFRGIIYSEENPVTSGKADKSALEVFASDCNTDQVPWVIPANRMNNANNKYHVESFDVISAYNDNTKKQTVLTAKIISIGESDIERGGMGFRKERLEKVVQLVGTGK